MSLFDEVMGDKKPDPNLIRIRVATELQAAIAAYKFYSDLSARTAAEQVKPLIGQLTADLVRRSR